MALSERGDTVVAPISATTGAQRPDPSAVPLRAPEGGLTADGLLLTRHLRPVPPERRHDRRGVLCTDALSARSRALRLTRASAER